MPEQIDIGRVVASLLELVAWLAHHAARNDKQRALAAEVESLRLRLAEVMFIGATDALAEAALRLQAEMKRLESPSTDNEDP